MRKTWALQPAVLEALLEFEGRCADASLRDANASTAWPAPAAEAYRLRRGVAIVPVIGILMRRPSSLQRAFGAIDVDAVRMAVDAAGRDPEARAIVLEIDSPGGQIAGVETLAALVALGARSKPTVAWSDGVMASGAYWIGSAAERVYLGSRTAMAGSIGVAAAHADVSRAEAMAGRKTTEICAGKYKRIASSYAPLTDEGRAEIQEHVDYLYAVFVDAVAGNRKVGVDQVLARMADGRMFIGDQAVDAGLADGIRAFDTVIDELARSPA